MKHKIFLTSLAVFLSVGILASLNNTFAQDGVNNSDTTAPVGGTITNDTNNVTGTTTDDGFNLLWLLPLIAIPILAYLLWPRRNEADEDEFRGDFAGAKGGRAQTEEYYDEEEGRVVSREKGKTKESD